MIGLRLIDMSLELNKEQEERWERNKDLMMWFVVRREEYETYWHEE